MRREPSLRALYQIRHDQQLRRRTTQRTQKRYQTRTLQTQKQVFRKRCFLHMYVFPSPHIKTHSIHQLNLLLANPLLQLHLLRLYLYHTNSHPKGFIKRFIMVHQDPSSLILQIHNKVVRMVRRRNPLIILEHHHLMSMVNPSCHPISMPTLLFHITLPCSRLSPA